MPPILSFVIGIFSQANNHQIKVHDCLIKAAGNVTGIAVNEDGSGADREHYNLKVWGCDVGLSAYLSAATTGASLFRNIECYNNDYAVLLTDSISCTFKNVSGHSSLFDDWLRTGAGQGTLQNCADSDDSINTQGFNDTNTVPNIVPANEYSSLDETNSNFLKIVPVSQLYKAGISVESGFDIQGWPRPKATGEYAIGSHELASGPGIYDLNSEDIQANPKEGIGPLGTQFTNIPVAIDTETT